MLPYKRNWQLCNYGTILLIQRMTSFTLETLSFYAFLIIYTGVIFVDYSFLTVPDFHTLTQDAKWCEPAQMCPVEDDEVTPPQLDLNDLITTCDQPNLRLKEGLANCQSMCKAHLCCWDPDAGKNCYKDHPRECDDYDACENLFLGHPTFDNPHSKDEIDELCL
eukprot:9666866-Ditylum_brightwellii.AAC.1